MKKLLNLITLLLLFITPLKATHMVGSDISYRCSGTPGVYIVQMRIYRDCAGIQICGFGFGPTGCVISGCTKSVTITGAAAPCLGTSFGSASLSVLPSVSGYDVVQLCIQQVTICSNCQTRTPGSYSPGIEVFTFEGAINLNGLPSGCCKIAIGYGECCRNNAITTLTTSQNFYTEAMIDRCQTPCNSAPVFTNDPVAVCCAGEDYIFNLGAIDPDGDSLSYNFGQSLIGAGSPAIYVSPYSAGVPFPFLGVPNANAPSPAGIHINPESGDISFRPLGVFVTNLVIEVKQWKLINGVYVHVGTTRRDVQFYSKLCLNNYSPQIFVYRSGVRQALPYVFDVCAGQQICLDVSAWDNQYDTTDLIWNNPAAVNPLFLGATWTPNYIPNQRRISGPRLDSFRFCWTPPVSSARQQPHFFTATAKDRNCPLPGRSTRGIGIRVLKVPNPLITVLDRGCGFRDFSYVQQDVPPLNLNLAYTQWSFETMPGSDFYNTLTQQSVLNYKFLNGGWYRYKLRLTTTLPTPAGCPFTKTDSIFNPFPVDVLRPDTFNCTKLPPSSVGEPVNVTAHAWWGTPMGNIFTFYQGGTTPGSGLSSQTIILRPAQFNTDSLVTLKPLNAGVRTYYKVVVRDFNNCKDSDEFYVQTMPLPLKELTPKIRICPGDDTSMFVGNNGGQPLSRVSWYKLPSTTILDSVSTLIKLDVVNSDSGTYVLKKADNWGCVRWDTTNLFINPPISFNTPHDTVCYKDPLFKMKAVSGTMLIDAYNWTELTIKALLSDRDTFMSQTLISMGYGLRGLVAYDNVGCYKDDTATIFIRSLPSVISKPPFVSLCRNAFTSTLPTNNIITNVPVVSKIWSYPLSPTGIIGQTLVIDSLKFLPTTLDNSPFGNYVYITVADIHGCKMKDSLLYAIFPITPVGMLGTKMCDFAPNYNLRSLTGFNPTGLNESWGGNGVYFNTALNRYEFRPADTPNMVGGNNVGGNVRAGLTLATDSNILSYEYRRTFAPNTPVLLSKAPNVFGATVQSPFGGCPSSDTIIMRVIKSPHLKAGSLPAICIGSDSFNITNHAVPGSNYTTAANPATSYWFFVPPNAGLGAIANGKTFMPFHSSIVVPNDGQQTYRIAYGDIATTCWAADTTTIAVNGLPAVDITTSPLSDSAVCQTNNVVYFSRLPSFHDPISDSISVWGVPGLVFDVSTASSTISWDLNNTANTEATYYVKMYYRNSNGCANKDSTAVRMQIPPQLQLGSDGSACEYLASFQVPVLITPSNPYGLTWGHNGTGTINQTTTPVSYNATLADIANGSVKFWTTTNNNRLCGAISDTVTYIIHPQPNAELFVNGKGCIGTKYGPLDVIFRALPTNVPGSKYIWLLDRISINGTGSPSDSIINRTFNTVGNYGIQLLVQSPNNCWDTSVLVIIEAWPTPNPDFTMDPLNGIASVARPFVRFTNNTGEIGFGYVNYIWDLSIDPITQQPRLIAVREPGNVGFVPDTGEVIIKLMATSDKGCIDSISKPIRINPDITVYIPSVFWPGSTVGYDGSCMTGIPPAPCNSKFFVSAHNFETIEIFVFNRWGKLVFQTSDINIGWNGDDMKSGGPCEQDAYIYQINAISHSGKIYRYSGSITLLR